VQHHIACDLNFLLLAIQSVSQSDRLSDRLHSICVTLWRATWQPVHSLSACGSQCSSSLGVTRYPHVALLAHSGSTARLLTSASGAIPPGQLLALLEAASQAYEAELAASRADADELVRTEAYTNTTCTGHGRISACPTDALHVQSHNQWWEWTDRPVVRGDSWSYWDRWLCIEV
jgi:hypothetical protein